MPKPFHITDVWNDGEYNICKECGQKYKCEYWEKCSYWKDKDKNLQCTCSDCRPNLVGGVCEIIERGSEVKVKVVFT